MNASMDKNQIMDGLQSPELDVSLVSAERQADAVRLRAEQLKRWQNSELLLGPARQADSESRVQFDSFECFIDAVKKNDVDFVWSFIRSGKDVNGPIVDGLTAIHQAVLCSSLDMIKLLVESNADVNVKDVYGWTPLHASVYTKDTEIVRYLIEKGADPLCVNIDLEFPVDICEQLWSEEDASSSSKFRLRDIKKVLVAATGDADVDLVRDSEKRQMLEDAKFLLENPDKPIPVCSEDSTPLHVAASKGYMDVLGLLVQLRNADINARDSDGWTALHAALFFEQDKAAELLMMAGASIHLTTNMNETLEDVCSDEMLEVFNDLKNQRPNYGSGMGSIGKRRLSFPIRSLRPVSIDQKDRDNERMILEQRGGESLSLEDSPELPRKPFSESHPPTGHAGSSQLPRPSTLNTGSAPDSDHQPKGPDKQDASGKYLNYGLKSQDGPRKNPYASQTPRYEKPGYRDLSGGRYSQKPSLPANGTANITTRRVRSDMDARNNGPGLTDISNDNSRSLVPPPGKPASASKLQRSAPLPSGPPDPSPPSESPSYSRSTSEIARKTVSRKSLDGRRKTQPVDQDVLFRAMEEYNTSIDTGEEQRNVGENGSEEVSATLPLDTSVAQETPNRTEKRFRISRIPSKESTGSESVHFTPSEQVAMRDHVPPHKPSGRIYSDVVRTPSQTRDQRPSNNRVSAIIGNFEKSGPTTSSPAPNAGTLASSSSATGLPTGAGPSSTALTGSSSFGTHAGSNSISGVHAGTSSSGVAHAGSNSISGAPTGSNSGSAVSLDTYPQREESGGSSEKGDAGLGVGLGDEFSPGNPRKDRSSYSSTTRKITKQPRRSTGISHEDVRESLNTDSLEGSEDIPTSSSVTLATNSHLSNSTHSSHSHLSHQALKNENNCKTELKKHESDSKSNITISHTRYNSKEERANNDSNFYKKLYEQEQNSNKKIQEELNQLRLQKELWEQDQGVCKRLQEELTQVKIDRELDLSEKRNSDKYISKMNRRLSDTTRAYEQEKKERTRQDLKLQQLQHAEQRIHQVEAEKQRIEDENKKLIEVIKSLSGTSF